MKITKLQISAFVCAALLSSACSKKVATTAPPAPTPSSSSAPATTAAAPARSTPAPAPAARAQNPRFPDDATRKKLQDLLAAVQDAYFDYDRHSIRPDAEKTLMANAKTITDILKQYPEYKLTVEGHADERGSGEYNMGLGAARAKATREYLVSLGIPADQLETVTYGKEKPVCTDSTEDCWQKNRRAHVVALPR